MDSALDLVIDERKRQIKKWGIQKHDKFIFLAMLMKEIGEASQAALYDSYGGDHAGTFLAEMVEVAAVAVQIIENELSNQIAADRRPKPPKPNRFLY